MAMCLAPNQIFSIVKIFNHIGRQSLKEFCSSHNTWTSVSSSQKWYSIQEAFLHCTKPATKQGNWTYFRSANRTLIVFTPTKLALTKDNHAHCITLQFIRFHLNPPAILTKLPGSMQLTLCFLKNFNGHGAMLWLTFSSMSLPSIGNPLFRFERQLHGAFAWRSRRARIAFSC